MTQFDNESSSSVQAFIANQEFAAINPGEGRLSIQVKAAGTMTGSMKLQISNNNVNWHDVKDASETVIETTLENDGCLLVLEGFYTKYVRPVYIGTDTGNATITVVNVGS